MLTKRVRTRPAEVLSTIIYRHMKHASQEAARGLLPCHSQILSTVRKRGTRRPTDRRTNAWRQAAGKSSRRGRPRVGDR
jgi:hypothetical protein